jgi:hypothetical protein
VTALTDRTLRLIERIPQPELRERLISRLEAECSRESLGCSDWQPEHMERLWFAILKLIGSKSERVDGAFALAKCDWRDLLVAAGFANDTDAHNKWWNGRVP